MQRLLSEDPAPQARTTVHSTSYAPLPAPNSGALGRATACIKFSIPVVYPERTPWLDRWDLLVLIVLVEVTFATPFELAFMDVRLDFTFCVNRVVDLIFLLDMLLRFRIAIPNPARRGCWVTQHGRIAWLYLQTWFWPDLLSLLPVDAICIYVGTEELNQLHLSTLRLARTMRLFRLTHGQRLLNRWRTSFGLRNWLTTILQLLGLLVVCCHWNACLWGAVGLGAAGGSSWPAALRTAKGGPAEVYEDPRHVYVISLYWAVMTITGIGYGDITPQSPLEYTVALLCMSMMAATWACVISEVCAVTTTFSPHEVNFKRTMDDLNWLLSDWGIDAPTSRRFRAYFSECRDMQRHLMQKAIVQQMSPMLQGEILSGLHRAWTGKVRYLRQLSDNALVNVLQRLRCMLFAPDEAVSGDRTLFIVHRGIAMVTGRVVISGDVWGEDMILHNSCLRRHMPAKALGYLELNMLHYSELKQVSEDHPELRRQLIASAKFIALHRSIVLISRVIKQLRFHGYVQSKPTVRQLAWVISKSLAGEIDGDFHNNPTQRQLIPQLLQEAAALERHASAAGAADAAAPAGLPHRAKAARAEPRAAAAGGDNGAAAAPSSEGGEGGSAAAVEAAAPGGEGEQSSGPGEAPALLEALRGEAEELLAAYMSRVEAILAVQGRKPPGPTIAQRAPSARREESSFHRQSRGVSPERMRTAMGLRQLSFHPGRLG